MEQSFLHLIAGIIRNTESTDKMHISKKSIRHFHHKLKQLPQVHVWKPNWVWHSKSKYFKITKKLLFPQHQEAGVVYHCGIYWQPWTCKGSQKVGTTLGSYCSIFMNFFQQNICCPMALTVRTFLFSQWFFQHSQSLYERQDKRKRHSPEKHHQKVSDCLESKYTELAPATRAGTLS